MTATRILAPRVAYQGEPGAYGEMAITREWGGAATAVPSPTFADALSALGDGSTDYAVVPVWNSTIGEIHDTNLLLTHHASRVEMVAEITVPVVHCLLGLPGSTRSTVRHVGSHPTALSQCRRFFSARPLLLPSIAHDTAGAARELAALGPGAHGAPARSGAVAWFDRYKPVDPKALAVIADARVARLYGLVVIAEGIQDSPSNATRFVVVRAQAGIRW
jgi:prephenate dehydratase